MRTGLVGHPGVSPHHARCHLTCWHYPEQPQCRQHRQGEARGSEAVVMPWLAGGMLVSPPERQQSPAMVTSPLRVRTLHLFLLQVWQHNKWKELTPIAYGKTPHVVGVDPVSQQGVDGASSMCLTPFGVPGSTSCHSKSRGERQLQAHCAQLMSRRSLLTTHSFSLSLGPAGQTWAMCPLAPLGSFLLTGTVRRAVDALLAFPVTPACPSFSAVPSGRSLEGSSLAGGREGNSGLPGSPKGEEGLHLLGDQLLAPCGFSSAGWDLQARFSHVAGRRCSDRDG